MRVGSIMMEDSNVTVPARLLVQVIRNEGGEAVLLQGKNDLVILLNHLLCQPLGSVLGEINPADEKACQLPLVTLTRSSFSFAVACKEDPPSHLDWTRILNYVPHQKAASQEPHTQKCLRCLKQYGLIRYVSVNSSCGYCNCVYIPFGRTYSLLNPKCYCPGCGSDTYINTVTGQCTSCNRQRTCTLDQVLSWPCCALCVATGQEGTMETKSKWMCRCCVRTGVPICKVCKQCDYCSLRHVDHTLPGAGTLDVLLTNKLDMVEYSNDRMEELLIAAGCTVDSVSTENVHMTPTMLNQMVLHALSGSVDVLKQSFPAIKLHADSDTLSTASASISSEFQCI